AVGDEVDAAIAGADRTARRFRELGEASRAVDPLAGCAARDVGDPAGAAAAHRGDRDMADDEDAIVAPLGVAADIALQVEDAVERLRVGQRLAGRDAPETAPLGAE